MSNQRDTQASDSTAAVRAGPQPNLMPALLGLKPSATLRISEKCNALRDSGEEVFKLGFGQSPFPVPDVVVEELKKYAHVKDYLPVRGLKPLRDRIAEYARATKNLDVTGEDVMVGPGSKQLIFLLQMATQCELLVPRPCWVSYVPQASLLGRATRWVETTKENGWELRAEDLEAAILQSKAEGAQQRLFIFNNPCNPTGVAVSTEEVRKIAAVARKHQIIMLADEIYDEFQFDGKHEGLAQHYPEGTITLTGISKWCGAGGWRMGAFVFPPQLRWLQDAMAVIGSETHSTGSAPVQYASIPAFSRHLDLPEGQEMRDYIRGSRITLSLLGLRVAEILNEAGAHVVPPSGGFYSWVDCSNFDAKLRAKGIKTSPDLAEVLISETGVGMLPSTAYGWPAHELCLHTAIVDFEGGPALEAVRLLPDEHELSSDPVLRAKQDAFLEEYCPRVLEGARRLGKWLQSL